MTAENPPTGSHEIPGLMAATPQRPHRLYPVALVVAYLLVAAAVALVVYCHVNGAPFNVTDEDGLVEWATVAAFSVCGLLAAAAAVSGWRQMSRAQRVLICLFAAAAFMAVGEELSWGQRFWGFRPPEAMVSGGGGVVQMGHNDTTWHNLSFELGPLKFSLGGMLFGLPLILGLFVHGVWLPLRARKAGSREEKITRRLGLFLPPVHLGVLLVVAAIVLHQKRLWDHIDARETKEMVVPMLYVFFLLHAYFRQRTRLNVAVTAASLLLLAAGLGLSVAAVVG